LLLLLVDIVMKSRDQCIMIDKGFSFLFIDRVNILDALVHA
jgi:hypothetical protein